MMYNKQNKQIIFIWVFIVIIVKLVFDQTAKQLHK